MVLTSLIPRIMKELRAAYLMIMKRAHLHPHMKLVIIILELSPMIMLLQPLEDILKLVDWFILHLE